MAAAMFCMYCMIHIPINTQAVRHHLYDIYDNIRTILSHYYHTHILKLLSFITYAHCNRSN